MQTQKPKSVAQLIACRREVQNEGERSAIYTLKGRNRTIAKEIGVGTVSKALLGKFAAYRETGWSAYGFSRAARNHPQPHELKSTHN